MKLQYITLIISAIALLVFTGCQESTNPVDTGTTTEGITVLNNSVEIDGDLATAQVTECSLETNAFIPGDQTIFEKCRFNGKGMNEKCPRNGSTKNHPMLGKVMSELQLTEAQIELVKEFDTTHHDCIETTMQTWRDAVQPIMDTANAHKKLIMDDLKNNLITRQEAKEKLKAVNIEMRAEMDALGIKDTIKAAIDACNKTLLDSIKGILTADQLVVWLKYFPE